MKKANDTPQARKMIAAVVLAVLYRKNLLVWLVEDSRSSRPAFFTMKARVYSLSANASDARPKVTE